MGPQRFFFKDEKPRNGECRKIQKVHTVLRMMEVEDSLPPGTGTDAIHALFPEKYIQGFLSQNIRPDSRSFDAVRVMSMSGGNLSNQNTVTCYGSSSVSLGGTRVVAGVTLIALEIPAGDNSPEGQLSVSVELGQVCSPRFQPGRPGEEAVALGQQLEDTLRSTRAVDLSSLTIEDESGKVRAVWRLQVDIACLNYEGNVCDAALCAAVYALAETSVPPAYFSERQGNVVCASKEKGGKGGGVLKIDRVPLSLTHAVFELEDKQILVVDPTSEEQDVAASLLTVTVVMDASELGAKGAGASEAAKDGKVCVLKQGGVALPQDKIRAAAQNARSRAEKIGKAMAANGLFGKASGKGKGKGK